MKHLYILITGLALGWLIGMSTSPVVATVISALLALIVSIVSIMAGVKPDPNDGSSAGSGMIGSPGILGTLFSTKLNPLPIMFVVIGVAVGAVFGNLTRNYNLLSPHHLCEKKCPSESQKQTSPGIPLDALVKKYTKYNLPGVDTAFIVKRVLELELPKANSPLAATAVEVFKPVSVVAPIENTPATSTNNPNVGMTGLINTISSRCDELCMATYSDVEILNAFEKYALSEKDFADVLKRTQNPDDLRKEVAKFCTCD